MPTTTTLHRFLEALPDRGSRTCTHDESLGAALDAALAGGAAAWPEIGVAAPLFAEFLARRLSAGSDAAAALQALHAGDLYLACACAQGDARALHAFEQTVLAKLDGPLAAAGLSSAESADVKQALRRDLFVAAADCAPLIDAYAGRGQLAGWLRVTAVRRGLRLLRQQRKLRPLDDQALQRLAAAGDDVELQYLKLLHRDAFQDAFGCAMRSLTAREANLLRQHFLDGLSTVQLGALYRVHQTTAARWVRTAVETLLARTRQELIDRLRLNPEECDSLIDLVQSRLEMTISRHLRAAAEGGAQRRRR